MNILVLTQQGGVLKPFATVLGYIMDYIYRFLESVGISNIGLTIVLLTLAVNIILIPITIKQQKFMRMSAIINPEIQKIQKKYQGRKDENSVRMMQAETSAVYDKYGASPTGGCLPTLIQIPILFALYRVILNVPAYVSPVREVYEKIATPIMSAEGAGSIIGKLMEEMSINISNFDIKSIDKVIDFLYKVKSSGWDSLSTAFASNSEVVKAISEYSSQVVRMNWLPGGMSIADNPINMANGLGNLFPGVLIPILAAVAQWVNIRVSQRNQKAVQPEEGTMANSMKTMNNVMPVMSLFFCSTLPAGIGIYWIFSAVFRTIITLAIDKFMGGMDIDQIVEANKEKAARKAEKRDERYKKVDEYASMSTKKARGVAEIAGGRGGSEETKKKSAYTEGAKKAPDKTSQKKSGDTTQGASIADIANMLKRKD